MKKIIGILGVAVIAMAMFFSTNTMNSANGDFDLASLINLNTANAECISEGSFNNGECTWTQRCVKTWDAENCSTSAPNQY